MPLDKPKSGESLQDYLDYCIPIEINAGKPQDQATAICASIYRQNKMSKLSGQDKIIEKLKYNRDFRGINLTNFGINSEACWDNYLQVGTKMVDGREVPNCVGPIEMETQPTIDSSYAGEPSSGSVELAEEINVLGYNTKHFSICPGAIGLFTHLQTMPLDDETIGMVRSAAQVADNVFRIEKEVVAKGKAETSQLNEVELLVDDFKDIIHEIDEEVGMIHDVSFMDGHIKVVKDLL